MPRLRTTAASAAEVGQTAPSPEAAHCDAGALSVAARTASHTLPGGVVTALRTANAGPEGTAFSFRVFRDQGDTGLADVAGVPAALDADGAATATVRIAVAPGDRLGLSKSADSALGCLFAADGVGEYALQPDVTEGAMESPFLNGDGLVNVAAIVEPDADGDGYGDESQDACPSDAALQTECLQGDPPPVPEAGTAAENAAPVAFSGAAAAAKPTSKGARSKRARFARFGLTFRKKHARRN
jgi:hypothetical protein